MRSEKTTQNGITHGRTEMFTNMIDNGMKVDLDLGAGKTMLYYAINKGNLDAVKYILKQGYDLSIKDNRNNTALHWAITKGSIDIVKELLRNGADVNAKNKWKKRLYILAFHNEPWQRLKHYFKKELTQKELTTKEEHREKLQKVLNLKTLRNT
ncbi:MAG: ankyrin repeat protein [Bacteroidia bacterium]|jgi:ankyrin repeat protein